MFNSMFAYPGMPLAEKFERFTRDLYDNASRSNISMETINAIKAANEEIQRSVNSGTGFTGVYIEPGVKYLGAEVAPFRSLLPRHNMGGNGIDKFQFEAITDFFGGNGPSFLEGVTDEGANPAETNYNTLRLINQFVTLSKQHSITLESELYGRMLEGDVRAAIAALMLPEMVKVEEMNLINSADYLYAPPPPLASQSSTGGSLAAASYWFLVTAVNANGETLASKYVGPITTTGTTSSISLTIFCQYGATKYNVYCGTGASQPAAGAMWLQSATTQFGGANALNQPSTSLNLQGSFTVTMTAAPATSGTAYSSLSGNTAKTLVSSVISGKALPFQGIQSLLYSILGYGGPLSAQSTAEGYMGNTPATPIVVQPASAAGTLALSDIQYALQLMDMSANADPDYIFAGTIDFGKITALMKADDSLRTVVDVSNGSGLAALPGGGAAGYYYSPVTGKMIRVQRLPFLPQGTVILGSMQFPHPVIGAQFQNAPVRVELNQELMVNILQPDQSHQNQWAVNGVVNETLVNQFPGGWGIINGVTKS